MKVVIVGGVAGGASAAARLRRLNEEAEIILPVGSIIEVDVSSRMQNICLSKTYRFIIPPYSVLRTQVEGVCLNRDLNDPFMANGRFTPFRYDSTTIDQNDIWSTVSRPAR